MRIGFTGHRPPKIFYKSDKPYSKDNFELLYKFICDNNLNNNLDEYNTGGALGFDTVIAEMCYQYNLSYNLYLPFKTFGSDWYSNDDRIRLERHKHKAKEVIYAPSKEGYSNSKLYVIRDKAIVNNSDMIISLWDGTKSGAKDCIKYANKQNKKVINIWDNWKEYYDAI